MSTSSSRRELERRRFATKDLGLDLAGLRLISATGISADGRTLVGIGTRSLGFGPTEAWVAVIPEPATALLVLAGLLGLTARR